MKIRRKSKAFWKYGSRGGAPKRGGYPEGGALADRHPRILRSRPAKRGGSDPHSKWQFVFHKSSHITDRCAGRIPGQHSPRLQHYQPTERETRAKNEIKVSAKDATFSVLYLKKSHFLKHTVVPITYSPNTTLYLVCRYKKIKILYHDKYKISALGNAVPVLGVKLKRG